MAKFECNWCGRCCTSFGEFIKVERQVTEHDYFCRYGITNELFQVHVLPEFADEFADKYEEMENNGKDAPPKGCVFSFRNPQGPGFACAIYPSRPTICREFLCYRMVINHHQTGEMRGKVIGLNELRTHDQILETIWKEKIAHLPHPFESCGGGQEWELRGKTSNSSQRGRDIVGPPRTRHPETARREPT